MDVALYTHLDMLGHRPGDWHYERPERLRAVLDALADDATLRLERREAPPLSPPRARPGMASPGAEVV